MADLPPISISSRLLEAIALWAYQGSDRPHLNVVAFRGGEMIATDGHRLVRIPIPLLGERTFGLRVEHVQLVCRAFGPKATLQIRPDGKRVEIEVNGDSPVVWVAKEDIANYPPIDQVEPTACLGSEPAGIVLNARYLADVQRIAEIIDPVNLAVRVTKWGGMPDPVLFEGPQGSRFVVMPMRGDALLWRPSRHVAS